MKFNIDKLRSWKLRYLVCDETGQIWAHEKLPIRVTPGYAAGYWKVADEFLPPHVTIYSSDKEWDEYKKHWSKIMHYKLNSRAICVPISDCPIQLSWGDDPYDLADCCKISE